METKKVNVIFYKRGLLKVDAIAHLKGDELVDFCRDALHLADDSTLIDALSDADTGYGRFDINNLQVEKIEDAKTLSALYETKISEYFGEDEAIQNLEYENKMMAQFLEKSGYSQEDIINISAGSPVPLFSVKKLDFTNDTEIIYTPENSDEGYTAKMLFDLCGNNRELATRLYEGCVWQSPETLLNEWQNNGSLLQVSLEKNSIESLAKIAAVKALYEVDDNKCTAAEYDKIIGSEEGWNNADYLLKENYEQMPWARFSSELKQSYDTYLAFAKEAVIAHTAVEKESEDLSIESLADRCDESCVTLKDITQECSPFTLSNQLS